MAAAYQPSEGFYAALSLFEPAELKSYEADSSFLNLHTAVMEKFRTAGNLYMSPENKTCLLYTSPSPRD